MNDESSKKQRYLPGEQPCVVCGKSEFEWGLLIAGKNKPGEFTYFRPHGSKWEDGDIPLEARRCEACGNVLLFILDV